MIEVIIPALNEEATISHIVGCCMKAPSIGPIHVVVDAKTTDLTGQRAGYAGAIVHHPRGVSGKGQLINYVMPAIRTPRVMLCDGDYTRFSPHIAEIATAAHHSDDTMRIIVPRVPTLAEWIAGGAPFPFHSDAWGVNSGLRSFPRSLVDGIELHGYLVETQLNEAAAIREMSISKLYEPSFVQPLRFSERRLQAMEEDRAWGVANGILRG